MARPLRIKFAGAIYHVMARGNGKQLLFHGEDDYDRMLSGLEKTVHRTGWEVFSFVWMPNHVHIESDHDNRWPFDQVNRWTSNGSDEREY